MRSIPATHIWRTLAVLALVVALALYVRRDRPATGVYRGHFTTGMEKIAFQPCGAAEEWWVAHLNVPGSDRLWGAAGVASPGRPPSLRAYVVWRGTRSARSGPGIRQGNLGYGHLNQYPREFTPIEIIEARPPGPADCE